MFKCEYCAKSFTRNDNKSRHVLSYCKVKKRRVDDNYEGNDNDYGFIRCTVCDVSVERNCYTAHIRSINHRSKAFVVVDDGVKKTVGVFGDRIVSYQVTDPSSVYIDIDQFSSVIRERVLTLLESLLHVHGSIKVNMELYGLYYLLVTENVEIKSFNTKNKIITQGSDIYDLYNDYIAEMKNKMSEFEERDSGWTLINLMYLEININKFNPMRASSYIDLPLPIKRKKAVINVQNADDACFAWAITSALNLPTGLPQRISSYPHYGNVADFSTVTFPTKLKEIDRFEEHNNISINVYGVEDYYNGTATVYEVVGPLHFTKRRRAVHINLLLITSEDGKSHYCWIKNLSRLVSTQKSQNCHQKYICEGCLIFFASEEKLRRHEDEDCKQIKAVFPTTNLKINKYGEELPENVMKFENFHKQLKVPFVVYADFEALLKPIPTAQPDPLEPFTIKCFEHEPYSYAYYLKCSFDDSLSKLKVYRGENAAISFVRELEADLRICYDQNLSKVVQMQELTNLEKMEYEVAVVCHICDKVFNDDDEKVRDHCHLTGEYRGAAHMVCNLNYKQPRFVPVICHNLTNYDSHLFVKSLALDKEYVDVIAQSKEKYISFSKRVHVGHTIDNNGKSRKVFYKLRFIDSLRFMNSSLVKLASYLEDDQCKEVRKYFCDEKFNLIRQKGIFPYNYVTSFESLESPNLPRKEEFYDQLTDSSVSEEDYARAMRVWELFECQTLGQYSDVYVQSDVLLLADVFENFRDICMENYKLDPAHFYTSPGLSWEAMLRMTGVTLELLTDVDMLHFFKRGIRGGVSMCTKRKEVANNEHLPNFDPSQEKKYILYLDATNLYGYAMSFKLPWGNFTWLTGEELANVDVQSLDDDGETGYVFEVDLDYPANLHDWHNDFPFCPEHVCPPDSKYAKLTPNLTDKKNYVIHYLTLKQCLNKGLQLRSIRRGMKFSQSNWLKSYIDFNTRKRSESANEFFVSFYKNMVNSIYGKTMENVENRVDIKLVTHWENILNKMGAEAYIAKPNFKSSKIFCDYLVAIELSQVRINYTKPVFVGFAVLEIAKKVMYDFFYDYLKALYNNNVTLLYTDTDSLVVSIEKYNVYDDIKTNLHMFDTSNYVEGNIHGIPRSLQRLGRMKDEYAGAIVECFYGTGSKAYCVKLLSKTTKTAKGVRRYVIDKTLSVADYKNVVEENGTIMRKMFLFRSDYHTMYTELKNKVALSYKDDKRYILPDNVSTLAWGHYRIEEIVREDNLNKFFEELEAIT